jgi:RNA polymerase sporulation-specific sigma factor
MDYKDYNDYELLSYIAEKNEDANNIMIKKYEPLINKIASKMLPFCKNNGLELSDLVQEGMIGLNHAIDRYQERENILFYTYAKTCIERKIISVVIAANRSKNKILNESISYDDEENLLLNFVKSDSLSPEEAVINLELEETLMNEIKEVLTDLEDQVFELLISGFKNKEIAMILDKDQKSVDNAKDRIKIKIKKVLENRKKD